MTEHSTPPSHFWPYSIGLLGLGSIAWLAVSAYAPHIETDLQQRIDTVLAEHEYPAVNIDVDGQDVTLKGLVHDNVLRATMIHYIEQVPGVRLVKDRLSIATPEPTPTRQARLYLTRDENHVTISGQLPEEVDLTALMTAMNRAGIDSLSDEAARIDELAPISWLPALVDLGPELIAIPDFRLSIVNAQFELQGTVASDEQSRDINRLVAEHINAFPVTSQLTVAEYEDYGDESDTNSTGFGYDYESNLNNGLGDGIGSEFDESRPWLRLDVSQQRARLEGLLSQNDASVERLLDALKTRHPSLDSSELTLSESLEPANWLDSTLPLTDSLFGLEHYELQLKNDKASINTFVQSNLVKKRLEQRFASLYPRLETQLAIEVRPESRTKQRQRLSQLLQQIDLQGVKFRYGTTEIDEQSTEVLDQVTQVLKLYPSISVEVAGHTDSYGDEYPNLSLSQRRAESVVRYLDQQGVDSTRLNAVGYGESNPIGDNATAQGRAKNRRIEFKF